MIETNALIVIKWQPAYQFEQTKLRRLRVSLQL